MSCRSFDNYTFLKICKIIKFKKFLYNFRDLGK
jgi:hypothetical protein